MQQFNSCNFFKKKDFPAVFVRNVPPPEKKVSDLVVNLKCVFIYILHSGRNLNSF